MTRKPITGAEALRRIADGKTKDLRYSYCNGDSTEYWHAFRGTVLDSWNITEFIGPNTPWKFAVEEPC